MAVAVIAALIVLIGSMLPWVTVSTPFDQPSQAGTDGDGKITLTLAVLALLAIGSLFVTAIRTLIGPVSFFLLLLGAATTAVAMYDIVELKNTLRGAPEFADFVSVGVGLYMALAGGLGLMTCAGYSMYKLFDDDRRDDVESMSTDESDDLG